MNFLELLFLLFAFYYVISIIFWFIIDCNAELWYKERFGVSISTMRGQVIWITGASSGIGKALAFQLASQGVKLVLSARRLELLQKVRLDCLKMSNGLLSDEDVLILQMDILEIDKQEQYLMQVLDHFGHLDVLVNNAGRSQRANWEDIDVKVDRELFELDVFSLINLSRIVVRYFKQQNGGRGHIAVTSSVAGLIPGVPFSASYCAAKHAVNAYMTTLTLEHSRIDATIFAPGPIATDFLQEAFTGKLNEKCVQTTTKSEQKRMTAERCGHLFAVAIANKLLVSWCGLFPVNFLTNLSLQWPTVARFVFNTLGRKRIGQIREGNMKTQ